MKRPKLPLNDMAVLSLLPEAAKFSQRTTEPNLWLVVYPTGAKFWRTFVGRYDFRIGKYPEVSITEAVSQKDTARKNYAEHGTLPDKRRGKNRPKKDIKIGEGEWFKKLVRIRNDLTRTLKEIDYIMQTNQLLEEES